MRAVTYARLVKLEHTVFVLPFAYCGMLLALAAADRPLSVSIVVWITLAMVGARTFAMVMNRVVDAAIDSANPRTATREIPSGVVTTLQALLLAAAALALLLVAVNQLDPITRWLWPIPVALFVVYPYTKRFTSLCHLVLGISVGLAPLAAWIAVRGDVGLEAVALMVGVAAWVAGFDVIYATHDIDFDRANAVHSLPARLGIARALGIARGLHLITLVAIAAAGAAASLGALYWVAVVIVAAMLAYEHSLVAPDDLTRVDAAFFTVNGIIGFVYFAGVAAEWTRLSS